MISDENLKVQKFCKDNIKAIKFFWVASNDFFSAMILIDIGFLSQGFILLQQSIEKYIKGIFRIYYPNDKIEWTHNKKYIGLLLESIKVKIPSLESERILELKKIYEE